MTPDCGPGGATVDRELDFLGLPAGAAMPPIAQAGHDLVRSLIGERGLRAGDRLPSVRELARGWKLSLAEARAALSWAKREGLIEIRPRSGAFVASTAPAKRAGVEGLRVVDGQQLYVCQARELLEVPLAAQAAVRRRPEDLLPIRQSLMNWLQLQEQHDAAAEAWDIEFHLSIARVAGNPILLRMVEDCLRRQWMDECCLPATPADRTRIIAIHREIYEAIRDQDAARAQESMRAHMHYLQGNILKMIEIAPTPGESSGGARREP